MQLVGGLLGDPARLVEVAVVNVHGGEIAEEHGALLDRLGREAIERVGQRDAGLIEPAGSQSGVASEPIKAGGVVVVEPWQCRGQAPGAVSVERARSTAASAAELDPAFVCISDSMAASHDATGP